MNESEGGGDKDDNVPEPDETVGLFVDNVEGEEAESVQLHGRSRHAHLEKVALGHLGKDGLHGIEGRLGPVDHGSGGVAVEVVEEIAAKVDKRPAQKLVRRHKGQNDDQPVEDFAGDKTDDVFNHLWSVRMAKGLERLVQLVHTLL